MTNAPALRSMPDVRTMLMSESAKKQLAMVAASHMRPERMMRIVANAARQNPKLYECDPLSLLGAMMTCATLGVEPNTNLGHAFLIPYANKQKGIVEAQLVIGYKGYIDLAFRSGKLRSLHADVVYDDDQLFEHEYGSNQHLRHIPGPRAGQKLAAYCHAKLENGEGHVVMSWQEVMAVRDATSNWQYAVKTGKTGEAPWAKHENAMAAKTAIRKLAQSGQFPMSAQVADALALDEQKVDYAAFAMRPDDGLPPVDDGNVVDGSTANANETPAAEEETKPKPKPKAPDKKTTAKAKEEKKAEDDDFDAKAEAYKKARHKGDDLMANLMDAPAKDHVAILKESSAVAVELRDNWSGIWNDVVSLLDEKIAADLDKIISG